MSVADRMAKRELTKALDRNLPEGSESSTLVPRDSPVIVRLRGLVDQLAQYQELSDGKFGRMGFMLRIITEELFEEIRDYDELTFAKYLVVVARITEWVATGDLEIVPAELRDMLAKIDGRDIKVEVEEIETVA